MSVCYCRRGAGKERFYDRFVTPLAIHGVCQLPPITRLRSQVVPHAEGVVLEIGMGTGLNLPHYNPDKVSRVIGVDPGAAMMKLAEKTARALPFEVELCVDSAEAMPLDDDSVDSVVVTYSFCSIPDARAALNEARRVMRPGGRLLFSEHGLSDRASTRRWQHRIDPVWTRFAGGCHLNRDMEQLLLDEGFRIEELEKKKMPGVPGVLGFNYRGSARPA